MMLGLLSLPNELISTIADELGTRKTFRGTCKRINAVLSPQLFSSITINIDEELIDAGILQLEALATKSTCAAEYVLICGRLVKEPNHLKAAWAQGKIRELLPEALSTLKGVTTVTWEMYSTDPDWASVLVSAFLETLPALSALDLTEAPEHPEPWVHLNRISNLTKLTVRGGPDATIIEIIANSPHLTHLDLLAPGRRHRVGDYPGTLHSFLGKVPRGRPLRLEHLGVTRYCVRFDDETLPHLRHLKSLELKYIHIPDDERQYYTEDLLSKLDRFGSSPEHLWGAVMREGIPIEMAIASADDVFIDYLASATRIKKIGLLGADTNVLAKKFFTQVVPRHSKTLVSLSVGAAFEGPWCFGKRNVGIFLECTQLSELCVSVNTSSTKGGGTYGPVNQIMAMAARMPKLYQLGLFAANQRMLRDRDGTPVDEDIWRTCDALCESVASFGPVNPAIHLNLIAVHDEDESKFRPQRGANGVIKYVSVQ
ncbi:hypothetical protein BD779DRAFT_1667131 [Infundibulicybe gibba]|nr:hypothetical protein BD779DRAFT_1667131 [Infundibulicybe gibba]